MRCSLCGIPTGASGLCVHHYIDRHTDGWAENNRIVCDFVHRKIVRPLAPRQRIREWELLAGEAEPAPPRGMARST
jgi:hypothetical protein